MSFAAMVDSGANISVIGRKGLFFLEKFNITVNPSLSLNVTTADGQRQEVSGVSQIPVKFDGKIKLIDFTVIPSIEHSFILGVNFCKYFKLTLNFNDKFCSAACDAILGLEDRSNLSSKDRDLLDNVVSQFSLLALPKNKQLPATDLIEHIIDTGNSLPINQRQYPISPYMRDTLNRELDEMLEMGVIRRSTSPWNSPVLLVKKSTGKFRFCFDGRKLNSVTKSDSFPLPYVNSVLDNLRNARFLSSVDLKSAFWQIPLSRESVEKTAFSVQGRGLFEFLRMPLELKMLQKVSRG